MSLNIPQASMHKVASDRSGGILISNSSSTANGGAVTVATVNAGGSGYTLNDVITISGGVKNATVRVSSVNVGVVTGVEIVSSGAGYTTGTGVATTGGTGTLLTLNITASAKSNAALSSTFPGATAANPETWVKIILPDGSTGYVPVWK